MVKLRLPALVTSAVLVAALSACSGGSDDASDAGSGDAYYAGKTIEIIVGSPGGTLDTMARFMAPLLTEHIEGNPDIQVVNVEGGGGIVSGNQFANSDPDGTTLIGLSGGALLPMHFGDPNVEYSQDMMTTLWANDRGMRTIYTNPDTEINAATDLENPPTELFFGVSTVAGGDLPVFVGLEALRLLDKFEIISGYESAGPPIDNAYAAGELNMGREATPDFLEKLEEQPDLYRGLYTHGRPDGNGGLERDPLMPELPHIGEVYQELYGQQPSGEAWDAFMLLFELTGIGGMTFQTHKEAPPEAKEALQAAFVAMAADPEYQEFHANTLPGTTPLVGPEAAEFGESVETVDPKLVEYIRTFLKDKFGETSFS